jgi:hypothetical protein
MASVEPIALPPFVQPTVDRSASGPIEQRESPVSRQGFFLSALFVGCLAFLLASFPARNNEVWLSLARGRDLVQGAPSQLHGPGWLYDLLLYEGYSIFGPTGLVFSKALLVAVLGLVLFRLCDPARGWWLPVVCTTLALLVTSTRLSLQPVTISYLFLALTLWYLHARKEDTDERSHWVPPWPLLILFVAWVNLDRWFLLGLATVALVYLGRLVERARPGLAARLGASLGLLTLVCLLNPEHFRVFRHLGDLLRIGSVDSSGLNSSLTSPFQEGYLKQFGTSPAGLAYYPLLGLGLLSFVALLPRWSAERLLPWLGLAAMSAVQVRSLGFFAVLGGPVLAWNLREIAEVKFRIAESPRRSTIHVLQLATAAVFGLVLLVAAWPGRLQMPPFEPRRWGFEFPPSLERGALTIQKWRDAGKLLPESRLLFLRPEASQAFAWFAPREQRVMDAQLNQGVREVQGGSEHWREEMRARKIGYVVLFDPSDRGQVFADLAHLLGDPEQWAPLYLEGGVGIFGWRDPARRGEADPFGSLEVDPNRLAFRPSDDSKVPREVPGRPPEPRRWWHEFWKPIAPRSLAHDEATMRLFHAEALRATAAFRHVRLWQSSQSAGLVAVASGWTGPAALVDAHLRLTLIQPQGPTTDVTPDRLPILDQRALALARSLFFTLDDTPSELLFLAIRAARRAVAENPDDASAYLVLGECYLRLLEATRERAWRSMMEELVQLRRAQAVTALNQAIALKPDLTQAHGLLARLYGQMRYLDLRLQHLRTYQELRLKDGPTDPAAADAFRDEQSVLQKELARLTNSVVKREDESTIASAGKPIVERAFLAMRKELAGKARDMLLASSWSAFGPRGMVLELELLLQTGRARDVWDWTGPEHEAIMGPDRYHVLRCLALAATGDYIRAEEECTQLNRVMSSNLGGKGNLGFRDVMALLIGQAVLDEQPAEKSWAQLLARGGIHGIVFRRRVRQYADDLRADAKVKVLRGLLYLEEGEVGNAEFDFRDALDLWKSSAAAATGSAIDFNGRIPAQGYLQMLESGWKGDRATR